MGNAEHRSPQHFKDGFHHDFDHDFGRNQGERFPQTLEKIELNFIFVFVMIAIHDSRFILSLYEYYKIGRY